MVKSNLFFYKNLFIILLDIRGLAGLFQRIDPSQLPPAACDWGKCVKSNDTIFPSYPKGRRPWMDWTSVWEEAQLCFQRKVHIKVSRCVKSARFRTMRRTRNLLPLFNFRPARQRLSIDLDCYTDKRRWCWCCGDQPAFSKYVSLSPCLQGLWGTFCVRCDC